MSFNSIIIQVTQYNFLSNHTYHTNTLMGFINKIIIYHKQTALNQYCYINVMTTKCIHEMQIILFVQQKWYINTKICLCRDQQFIDCVQHEHLTFSYIIIVNYYCILKSTAISLALITIIKLICFLYTKHVRIGLKMLHILSA